MDLAWYPACCEPLYFISLHALCFFLFFDPPAVLKVFWSNIRWGAYRVIASYQWPTQCRARLRINGPTQRIQWQGKDRAHSTSSLSLWLTDEMIQSLPFLFTCPCSFSVQPSCNSMLHHLVLVIIMSIKFHFCNLTLCAFCYIGYYELTLDISLTAFSF